LERTILLGINNGFPLAWTRRLYLLSAICNTLAGISFIIREGNLFWLILGVVMLCTGIFGIAYAILAFSGKSKYAPRISLNEGLVYIRETIMKPGIEISWGKIKNIRMAYNSITFSMPDSEYEFSYRANADTSLKIKAAVREMAELKSIEVLGG